MNKKINHALITGLIFLILSYVGYFVFYVISKQRLLKINSQVTPESVTFFGSIPGIGWFVLYSLIFFIIGAIIGLIIQKVKSKK